MIGLGDPEQGRGIVVEVEDGPGRIGCHEQRHRRQGPARRPPGGEPQAGREQAGEASELDHLTQGREPIQGDGPGCPGRGPLRSRPGCVQGQERERRPQLQQQEQHRREDEWPAVTIARAGSVAWRRRQGQHHHGLKPGEGGGDVAAAATVRHGLGRDQDDHDHRSRLGPGGVAG